PSRLITSAAYVLMVSNTIYCLEKGTVNLAVKEYISPNIVLYITINMIIDNAKPTIGEIVLAKAKVGISTPIMFGYSDSKPELIKPNNTKSITPPIIPPKPEICRLSASPPIATKVLNPTENAKPP